MTFVATRMSVVVYADALDFASAETTGCFATQTDRKSTVSAFSMSFGRTSMSFGRTSMSLRARREFRLTSDRLRFFDFTESCGWPWQSPRCTIKRDAELAATRSLRSGARGLHHYQ